jgi:hypothetical protein
LYQADGIYNGTSTFWSTPYISSLKVGALSAVSTNTGSLTISGTLQSNTAAISGTTMTGSGGVLYSTGNFAFGNDTTNIAFNGSQMSLNGNVVATGNINLNATSSLTGALSNTQPLSVMNYNTDYTLSYLATTSTGLASTWVNDIYAEISGGLSLGYDDVSYQDTLLYWMQKIQANGVIEKNYFTPRQWYYMTNIDAGGVTINWGVRVLQNPFGSNGMLVPYTLSNWAMLVSQFKR